MKANVNISVLSSDMRLNNANTLEHQSFQPTFLIVLLVYLLSSSNTLHVALRSTPLQNRQNNARSFSLFFPFFSFLAADMGVVSYRADVCYSSLAANFAVIHESLLEY